MRVFGRSGLSQTGPTIVTTANQKARYLLALLVFANVWLGTLGTQRTVYRAGDEIVTITRTKVDSPANADRLAPGYSYYSYTAERPQAVQQQPEIVYYTNANGITTRQYQTAAGTVTAATRRILYDDGTASEGIGSVPFILQFAFGQGCSRNPCGVGATCQETAGGRPVCSCPAGYSGNPLVQCRRDECLDHSECRSDQACRNGNCVNPCAGVCGINANCEVRNHVPVCSCPRGRTGDPFSSCRLQDPEELCRPSPCGSNTKCNVVNGVPTCSCLPGYIGSPLSGCRHECESDVECSGTQYCSQFKCVNGCNQCGKGATCARVTGHRAVCECPKGYIGSPFSECRPECFGDRDCPAGRPACIYGICKNPCEGACGVGADCNLRGLTPVCSCPRDMTGDPFISCRPFTKEDLCNPNPCGTNAVCTPGYDRSNQERPVCTCPPGYTGNALSACVRGECQSDSECSDHKACISYQCVDPCAGQCGVGAQCQAKRHLAVCTCPAGTQGDALVSCRTARNYPVARYNKKRSVTP
ncbi:neurogenic locus notch homolog protein 3-like isoform X1 [Anopheles darlingi]|uniref:neurogenic locus notch homolog protein 3-like isoform X1 n=1 Tax=Anopheles darlingi TaxID=43151 RepID=UPI00210025B0|nr:neurogenic locus notch homolog protein 3-like isoform X1 [Anopheles darlingi]